MTVTEAGKTRRTVFYLHNEIGTLDNSVPDSLTKLITGQGKLAQ